MRKIASQTITSSRTWLPPSDPAGHAGARQPGAQNQHGPDSDDGRIAESGEGFRRGHQAGQRQGAQDHQGHHVHPKPSGDEEQDRCTQDYEGEHDLSSHPPHLGKAPTFAAGRRRPARCLTPPRRCGFTPTRPEQTWGLNALRPRPVAGGCGRAGRPPGWRAARSCSTAFPIMGDSPSPGTQRSDRAERSRAPPWIAGHGHLHAYPDQLDCGGACQLPLDVQGLPG